jgi:ribosomal protein L7/L12
MQLFGFDVPMFVIIIVVVLLIPTVLRRMARRAGKAVGAATAARPRDTPAGPGVVRSSSQTVTMTSVPGANIEVTVRTSGDVNGVPDISVQNGTLGSPLRGSLGVAEVTSVSSWGTDADRVGLELDAIGAPKRNVSAPLPSGLKLENGDRVYVLIDPEDDQDVSILPASMTGGQSLPKGGNRLDALVLGPQLLKSGSQASGVVKSAEPQPLGNPALAAHGMSKWLLELEVQPERGWPYRAELTITLSTPEKAARIAHPGAEVLLRYDPEDPKTLSIDSIAMGYGDPYESLKAFSGGMGGVNTAAASGMGGMGGFGGAPDVSVTTRTADAGSGDYKVVLEEGGDKKIHAIKTLRDVRPDLSLKAAKDIVESRWETVIVENVSEARAESIRAMFEAAHARVSVRRI